MKQKPLLIENYANNLSSKTFTKSEYNLLNLGLKFSIKPLKDPIVNVVTEIETTLKYKPENVKHNVRQDTKRILKEYKSNIDMKPNQNKYISKMHKTLKNLKKNKEAFYMKADKGNSVVIMDKSDYEEKILTHISTGNYKTVNNC